MAVVIAADIAAAAMFHEHTRTSPNPIDFLPRLLTSPASEQRIFRSVSCLAWLCAALLYDALLFCFSVILDAQ
jgi:hypothetical protein